METHPSIRIFLSSPGDVVTERSIILKYLDELRYDPFIRKRAVIDAVSWDRGLPLKVTLHPQEAINQGLAKPSECDIVFVLFWSRMGTPLPFPEYKKPDGTPYLSGTEWEYKDAFQGWEAAKKPDIYLYRRTEKVVFDEQAPEYAEKRKQYERVEQFFKQFVTPEGALTNSINTYKSINEFREVFEQHVRTIIWEKIAQFAEQQKGAAPLWTGSPFPGLRAFTRNEAPIFVGRERELEALFARVTTSSFTAIVGASGSGKSSLVNAGLLSRLQDTRQWLLPTMQDKTSWKWLRCTPAEERNPLRSLASAFVNLLAIPSATAEHLAEQGRAVTSSLDSLVQVLHDDPDTLVQWIEHAQSTQKDCEAVVLLIDQFEEIFTCEPAADRLLFVNTLIKATAAPSVRVLITLRADFYHRCLEEFPQLTALLETGTFPLSAPGFEVLHRMLEVPAGRAGLEFEPGLVDDILRNVGSSGDALPLLAYALDLLYRGRDKNSLKRGVYENFKGIQGAIGTQAELVYSQVSPTAQAALPRVFRSLALVGIDQRDVRRHALREDIEQIQGGAELVDALIKAHLLVSTNDLTNLQVKQPMITVAHEAIFTQWQRLNKHLNKDREFRLWRQRLTEDVERWKQNPPRRFRLPQFRFSDLYLGRKIEEARRHKIYFDELSSDEQQFIRVSNLTSRCLQTGWWVALVLMTIVTVSAVVYFGNQWQIRQSATSQELVSFPAGTAQLGDPLRDVWVDAFTLEKYEVSYRQYRLCVQSRACTRPVETEEYDWFETADEDRPVVQVSAYQALEFCQWIGRRLPTAAEWERAARGTQGRTYPWEGDTLTSDYVNIPMADDPTAGVPPVAVDDPAFRLGSTSDEVMHLFGNVAEWTSTLYDCADPYTCDQVWDGVSPASLLTKGYSWLTPLEAMSSQPMADSVSFITSFTILADIGFRCAATP